LDDELEVAILRVLRGEHEKDYQIASKTLTLRVLVKNVEEIYDKFIANPENTTVGKY